MENLCVSMYIVQVDGKTVEEDYFESWSKPCDEEEANDKCYILVSTFEQWEGILSYAVRILFVFLFR